MTKAKRRLGFTVQDMLTYEIISERICSGARYWPETGVTIIESPDIVRFISGGEVLRQD